MFVKICGTTNTEDALRSVALGAEALGFIFAPSRRRVTAEQAAEITARLPREVMRVGVFTLAEPNEIARTVRSAGLNAVQMHWPYEARHVQALHEALDGAVALWQVVGFAVDPVNEEAALTSFAQTLRAALLDPLLDVVLLDAVKGGASGGMGEPFSWSRAASLVEAGKQEAETAARMKGQTAPRIVVAGGLRAENVGEAIQTLQPWGVDVVSGVEASPGMKSPEKLKAFLDAAEASFAAATASAGDQPRTERG